MGAGETAEERLISRNLSIQSYDSEAACVAVIHCHCSDDFFDVRAQGVILDLPRNEILGANEEILRPNHTSLLDILNWKEYYSIIEKGNSSNVILGDYVHVYALAH